MKIKHVEELVGITSKNIRFYEAQGLLTPNRAENGYREYGAEDIDRLRRIKLLRKLGVSIEEINELFLGQLRLEECLDRHLDVLERQKDDLTKMQALAEQIIASHATMQSLDIDSCLEQVEQMEKEGTSFMRAERENLQKKKRTGTLATGVVILLLAVVIPIALVLGIWASGALSLVIMLVCTAVIALTGVPIVVVVWQRMKEIRGGEEDEAVKY